MSSPPPVQAPCVSAGDGSCHTHPGGWMIACDAARPVQAEAGAGLACSPHAVGDEWRCETHKVVLMRTCAVGYKQFLEREIAARLREVERTHAEGLAEALERALRQVHNCLLVLPESGFKREVEEWLNDSLTAWRAVRGGGG